MSGLTLEIYLAFNNLILVVPRETFYNKKGHTYNYVLKNDSFKNCHFNGLRQNGF